jgi:hypothetical protein
MMNKRTISSVLLERYACGEVTDEEKCLVEAECGNDSEVREQLAAIKTSNTEILSTYAPEKTANEIALKMHREQVRMTIGDNASAVVSDRKRLRLFPAWSYSILLLVFIVPFSVHYFDARNTRLPVNEREKGLGPSLTIYRDEVNSYNKLTDSSVVSAGDRLQIGYTAAGKKFGIIFSVDGNGVISLHYPVDTLMMQSGSRLEQGGEQLLNTSFELDSAPLFERFYFLTSDDTIDVKKLIGLCGKLFANGVNKIPERINVLPETINQSTITLKKDFP